MPEEKRKNQRFEDSANSLIFNIEGTAGKLMNISLHGLAFIYMGDDFNRVGEQIKLDLLCAADAFYLKNLSCELVSIKNAFKKAVPRTRTVLCSVRFCNLTEQQRRLMKEYIDKISQRETGEETEFGYPADGVIEKSGLKSLG